MSAKSNELIPDQASFQDTYAWILFKMGDFKEAKTWLEKALDNGGDNDETVLDHYGDVLFELNDVEGAIQYWKLAKEKGLDAEIIDKKILQAQSKER